MGDLAYTENRSSDDKSVTTTLPHSPSVSSDISMSMAPLDKSTSVAVNPRAQTLPPSSQHPSIPISLDPATFSTSSSSSSTRSAMSPVGETTQSPHSERHSMERSKSSPTSRQRNVRATGFRASATLIPIDAPTQPRTYFGPSATSRKDLQAVAVQLAASGNMKGLGRKRSRAAAGLKLEGEGGVGVTPAPGTRRQASVASPQIGPEVEEDELAAESVPSLPDTATIIEKLEDKRRKNALSARKSRQLKKETKEALEREVARLRGLLEECERDRDYWRNLAERGSGASEKEMENAG